MLMGWAGFQDFLQVVLNATGEAAVPKRDFLILM